MKKIILFSVILSLSGGAEAMFGRVIRLATQPAVRGQYTRALSIDQKLSTEERKQMIALLKEVPHDLLAKETAQRLREAGPIRLAFAERSIAENLQYIPSDILTDEIVARISNHPSIDFDPSLGLAPFTFWSYDLKRIKKALRQKRLTDIKDHGILMLVLAVSGWEALKTLIEKLSETPPESGQSRVINAEIDSEEASSRVIEGETPY